MMKSLSSIKVFAVSHKVITTFAFVALMYGGHIIYGRLTSTAGETRYVVALATKTTLITSVTGSGQVSSSNQVDLKSKAGGEVLSLPTPEGSDVAAGTPIAYLDPTDAEKVVRDAATNLETARLTLEKLQQPPDQLQLTQSENSLLRAITAKQNAEDSLKKATDDGFNSVANAFLDLPGVISGLHDLLYTMNAQLGGTNVQNVDYYTSTAMLFDQRGQSFGADANTKYQLALTKYNQNFQDYKALSRTDDLAKIEAAILETYDTSLALSEAVKSANNLIQFYQDQMTQHNQKIPTLATTQLTALNGYSGQINAHLSDLLSVTSALKNSKNGIIDATRSIDENTQSLAKLKAGADALDLRSAQLSVTQREDALLDAKTALVNSTVRALFAGTLAKLSVKKGDTVGNGTLIGTLIAKQKIAQLSLNEVDAAKVSVGEKSTLTFDAIDGLSISGSVASIESIGTVTQGVVTYAVKISFDTQDNRVKPGMSVNASIITNALSDVLTVPSSAVKVKGNTHTVQVFDTPLPSGGAQGTPSPVAPRQVEVVIGSSNDTETEIVSGLKEGDQVVTRTVTATTATTAAAPSILPGGNRGGGGFRIGG